MKNWKTTVSGVALAVALIANSIVAITDNDPATQPDPTAIMAAISTLTLAWHAKDKE